MTSRHVNNISGRLSLRSPQRTSLEILDRVMELARPHKGVELKASLDLIRTEFPSVEDFERAFPSLCFALATGVGKTRLMGAFIAYLHLEHGIRNFFVLAPNLTIYNKLVADFTPNTPKYVFQGIAEFAVKAPTIVTGENYDQKPQVLSLFERDDVVVNIFNISKFNEKAKGADEEGKKTLKVRRLSEFLGQSYFDYLAGLDDLVLIMDEAHRYRADTSAKSIEELKPVLGLELTATPQLEAGSKSSRFRNVIFDYPLSQAMQDGYVKEPAVATREEFDPTSMSKKALERLKLEDGVRIHEESKGELQRYALQNGVRKVKPFMLVIAENTDHAAELVALIESKQFFNGGYEGRVIEVHSGQKGAEKDENVERLLSVERADESTEIVIHVNMLKEGWDVTNLYTIVPLRTADSRTLVEQSIGRGLRLPYGKRTGVAAVDRLTIVAHDRFQAIVDEAKKGGYSFSTVHIGKDVAAAPKKTVLVAPTFEAKLGLLPAPTAADSASSPDSQRVTFLAPDAALFSAREAAIARLAIEEIAKAVRNPQLVPGTAALKSAAVQSKLVEAVLKAQSHGQLSFNQTAEAKEAGRIVRKVTEVYVDNIIAIPRVTVVPTGVVRAGFRDFTLDLSSLRLQPVAHEILIQYLNSDARHTIGALANGITESRVEDYVVRGLIDLDDINYDDHADLLYALATQVVAHLRSYLSDDDEVRNVLMYHQQQISQLVHAQMQAHAWEEASSYEAITSQGFSEFKQQAFAAPVDELVRIFDKPIGNKLDIRNMLFGGFSKCLYPTQKFDSDSERRFAAMLEQDDKVCKWFKPGKGVFRIGYSNDNDYEPDFAVETDTAKFLCEPKRADQMQDPIVLAKARAAATWCKHATNHELANGGKPWRYVLIPHDAIADNMTLGGLAKKFAFAAPEEGK